VALDASPHRLSLLGILTHPQTLQILHHDARIARYVMFARSLAPGLIALLEQFPAVALLGPRQAGKTTLAHALAEGRPAVYLDLELPSHRARLSDPELYLQAHERDLVILDEIQRVPELFAILRGVIDRRKRQGIGAGQFLLLGSASLDLLQQTSESLAGRIVFAELGPFHLLETPDDADDRLWIRGGFPESYLARTEPASATWRRAFIRTYLERDIPALGPRLPAETLHRFWRMLAHNQGQLLNTARLASSLGISGQTVSRYLDLMVDLLLVRRLPPWKSNGSKRLVRAPKTYLRDSGVLHALLDIEDREQLFGHPVAGASWEGHVIENILAATGFQYAAHFYRTSAGAEIDLVLDAGKRRRYAIEVKRSIGSPHPAKGFYLGCEDIAATHRYVVYPGTERYSIGNGVTVTPLADLLRELAS
jgi:uncharacterized protein